MSGVPKLERLFLELYRAETEEDVQSVLRRLDLDASPGDWRPLGGNDNNSAIIQNQQGQPTAALVEKLTNAIDAVLSRRVLEAGVDPRGKKAPRTMAAAVRRFFDPALWNDKALYDAQAQEIQLLATGPRGTTSLVVYDEGEGQHPDDFPDTFLSLVRGNKKDIPFVQGLYNMGGTGAIVFCGSRKFQLVGSRRYDRSGDFGFTLVRRHPLDEDDERSKRAAWYEYLVLDGRIPRFPVSDALDLGLRGRTFSTGTILKLYSYQLPPGLRSNIAQALHQGLSELLVEPALPIWVADSHLRYPDTKVIERSLVGLRRSIEQKAEWVERHLHFDESTEHGRLVVDCFVFKAVLGDRDFKKARESIRRQFFQNGGSVLFAVNGQVHGSWSMQFVSQSLAMPLLKNHLLVIVDCTFLAAGFRGDLFMASRDRLANSEQAQQLREILKSLLAHGELEAIHESRKQSLGVQSGTARKAIRSYVKSLALNSGLQKVLAGQLSIEGMDSPSASGDDTRRPRRDDGEGPPDDKGPEASPFVGRKFPSFFQLARPSGNQERTPAARIPLGGSRTVKFRTDVEDGYFSRADKPGKLELTLLRVRRQGKQGEQTAGKARGRRNPAGSNSQLDVSDLFHVTGPDLEGGEIRLQLNAEDALNAGDAVEIAATLSGELTDLSELFWVRVVDTPKRGNPRDRDDGLSGLPDAVLVGRARRKGSDVQVTWEDAELGGLGRIFDEDMAVYPLLQEDRVERIYINIDCRVLLDWKSERGNIGEDQIRVVNNQYIAAMYLHTLMLCAGLNLHGYGMNKPDPNQMGEREDVDAADFIADVFSDGYAEFLLRFGTKGVLDTLEE